MDDLSLRSGTTASTYLIDTACHWQALDHHEQFDDWPHLKLKASSPSISLPYIYAPGSYGAVNSMHKAEAEATVQMSNEIIKESGRGETDVLSQ